MSVCVGRFGNCGSRSSFYVIDDKRGFKEFETREDAEYAHRVQSKLAMNNLAPLVLSDIGMIRLSYGMELSGLGYITEIAEMICCGGNDGCENCEYEDEKIHKKKLRLCAKIYDMGLEFMDAHVGNVGYVIRRGKKVLVCIDCGEESVYDVDQSYDSEEDYCDCELCKQRKAYA